MLGTVELASPPRRVGVVALARPVVSAGGAVRFGYTLPAGSPDLCALSAVVRFDDPAVRAHDLRVELPEPGHATTAWTMRDGTAGWLVGDPLGMSPVPREGWFEVVLDTSAVPLAVSGVSIAGPDRPSDQEASISGLIRVHGTAVRTGVVRTARRHAAGDRPVRFEVAVPGASRPVAARTAPRPAVRLCLAVDTEQYRRFAVPEAARAQRRFVELLDRARRRAGLDDADVDVEPSGDGVFVLLPAGVDETVVIPSLVEGIRAGLTDLNRDLNDRARLRLRVAMHRGHVAAGANGWLGSAVTTVHRLLDSDALRRALADTPAADFALMVSDVLYRDVIVDGYQPLDPGEFAAVVAAVPAKQFAEPAWLYVPGA
ncbi:hypothetical protein ACQPZF_27740 [Actinosynnema sp. CS-041913]|uniref:hypothetical protein n=1 Tax=Actinosynnema sp. CS-041913 TaxID=3239917 RepID=UPI003D8F3934